MKWIFKNLHWLTASLAGIVWCIVFLFFGVLHGDWEMYIQRFPFLIASILPIDYLISSILPGLGFALLDAILIGLVFGYLVRLILKKM